MGPPSFHVDRYGQSETIFNDEEISQLEVFEYVHHIHFENKSAMDCIGCGKSNIFRQYFQNLYDMVSCFLFTMEPIEHEGVTV